MEPATASSSGLNLATSGSGSEPEETHVYSEAEEGPEPRWRRWLRETLNSLALRPSQSYQIAEEADRARAMDATNYLKPLPATSVTAPQSSEDSGKGLNPSTSCPGLLATPSTISRRESTSSVSLLANKLGPGSLLYDLLLLGRRCYMEKRLSCGMVVMGISSEEDEDVALRLPTGWITPSPIGSERSSPKTLRKQISGGSNMSNVNVEEALNSTRDITEAEQEEANQVSYVHLHAMYSINLHDVQPSGDSLCKALYLPARRGAERAEGLELQRIQPSIPVEAQAKHAVIHSTLMH